MEQWDIVCNLRTRWEYDNRLNVMVIILVIFKNCNALEMHFKFTDHVETKLSQLYKPCNQ